MTKRTPAEPAVNTEPAAPVAPLPMPNEGGSYIRHPDGSLERVEEPKQED